MLLKLSTLLILAGSILFAADKPAALDGADRDAALVKIIDVLSKKDAFTETEKQYTAARQALVQASNGWETFVNEMRAKYSVPAECGMTKTAAWECPPPAPAPADESK